MKRTLKLLAVTLAVFLVPAVLSAAEVEPEGTMCRKLQRGFLNAALSPIEISNELSKEMKKEDAIPPSWLTGAARGSVYAVGRALVGVYEVVTFAIPYPANYQPVLKPEFPWQHLPSNKE